MTELQSPTDHLVFFKQIFYLCRHHNMNRIRLVWSCIWNVLAEFFVSVGLSENLSVTIFVMDSLRQLAMKFLEREELAHYNFQNEFLRPFVVVMQKSVSSEIPELIVQCVSQMVLDGKVFLQFNSDVSLNAIAFLRFCAIKLAEGVLVCYDKNSDGLSKLTSDPRPTIRKGALEVFFYILKDHGSKLSEAEWKDILVPLKESAASMLPVFSNIIKIMQNVEVPDRNQPYSDGEQYSDHEFINDDEEEANMETTSYAIVRTKNDISVQLQIVQCREEKKADSDGGFGNGGDSTAEGMLMCLEEFLKKCHLRTGHNL
ncbi:hypothetical protein MUK42_02632 [Musa troglodytarum]|uniref:Mon2/Sec7/BIG1-like HDS domain-containing protein n=1 Tax=Musa troglodytarum TaxID=320322 RepID=A0A9E7KDM6_9LILI|nr:hypothetical protein MUK42_02632 [Musa troglodytarum]